MLVENCAPKKPCISAWPRFHCGRFDGGVACGPTGERPCVTNSLQSESRLSTALALGAGALSASIHEGFDGPPLFGSSARTASCASDAGRAPSPLASAAGARVKTTDSVTAGRGFTAAQAIVIANSDSATNDRIML